MLNQVDRDKDVLLQLYTGKRCSHNFKESRINQSKSFINFIFKIIYIVIKHLYRCTIANFNQ